MLNTEYLLLLIKFQMYLFNRNVLLIQEPREEIKLYR